MKNLKSIIFAIATVFIVNTVNASDTKRSLAVEYIKLTKIKETNDFEIETQVNYLSAKEPSIDKKKLQDHYNGTMGWEVIKEPLIKVVLEKFTEVELKEINDFYKSKLGNLVANRSQSVSNAVAQLIMNNVSKNEGMSSVNSEAEQNKAGGIIQQNSKVGQKIIGKWESSGIAVEFSQKTASWPGGGCKHSGYKSETKQVDGEKFEIISFTCNSFSDGNSTNMTLGAVLVDSNKIVFMKQNYFRIK